MKWVGGITAVLSLIFAVQQAIQLVSDNRDQRRQVAELYAVGKQQQSAADFGGAWSSFEQALKTAEQGGQLAKLTGQLGKERFELRQAQEDLAMEWLRNTRVSQGQSFSDIVDKLVPVLVRGAAGSGGGRKADLLAHTGWANFLRWRDGNQQLDPAQQYQEALDIDAANPYAHAHWGHWILWRREKMEDAQRHFSAALASGQAREYVRQMQLTALKNLGEQGEGEFLAAVNDMRRNNEQIGSAFRNELYSIYYFACAASHDASRFTRLVAAVPAVEQIDTVKALFYTPDGAQSNGAKRASLDACLATLLEAAGQAEEALRLWQALRQQFPPGTGNRYGDRAQEAIKRLSPGR
jgi:hypothetical protein